MFLGKDEHLSPCRGKDDLCGEYWKKRDGASVAGVVWTLWNGEIPKGVCSTIRLHLAGEEVYGESRGY